MNTYASVVEIVLLSLWTQRDWHWHKRSNACADGCTQPHSESIAYLFSRSSHIIMNVGHGPLGTGLTTVGSAYCRLDMQQTA